MSNNKQLETKNLHSYTRVKVDIFMHVPSTPILGKAVRAGYGNENHTMVYTGYNVRVGRGWNSDLYL